jgi:hypothetical protein
MPGFGCRRPGPKGEALSQGGPVGWILTHFRLVLYANGAEILRLRPQNDMKKGQNDMKKGQDDMKKASE